MKFDKFLTFYNHLESSKEHPSSFYAVLMTASDERREVLKMITSFMKLHKPSLKLEHYSMDGLVLAELLDAFESQDLFSKERLFVLDDVEKTSKGVFETLITYLEKNEGMPIVFLGQQFPQPSTYERLKKNMVLLSLTAEKPWEKQERIKQWAFYYLSRHKKKTEEMALDYLMEVTQWDFASIKQEIDKWICYSVDQERLTLDDLKKVCQLKASTKQWTLTETLVWYKNSKIFEEAFNLSLDQYECLSFIGGIRYHANLGVLLKDVEMKKLPLQEVQKKFPQMQMKALEKYALAQKRYASSYFEKILSDLISFEFRLKTTSDDPTALWKQLIMKMELYKS